MVASSLPVVVSWKWSRRYRESFTAEHVNALLAPGGMVDRHWRRLHRRICITDDPRGIDCETVPLWGDGDGLANASGAHLPSCYRRLKLFSADMCDLLGVAPGTPLVSVDLDVVAVADLGPLWEPMIDARHEFVGWARRGTNHDRVYNGSMWLCRAAALDWLWRAFDPLSSPAQAKAAGYLGSDQAFMSWKLGASMPGWTEQDGVYHYTKDVRPPAVYGGTNRALPPSARMVMFCGKRKPWHPHVQREAAWIGKHWLVPARPAVRQAVPA